MTRKVEIGKRAARRIEEIRDWTLERFGARQALDYESILLARIAALRHGTAHVRTLDRLTRLARHRELLVTRAGMHLFLMRAEGTSLVIVDVVHSHSDIAARADDTDSNESD